ncbi:DUF2336 domain-containing protein [Roseococcus sp. SDR]|uniref:DUF2336 domain-containing protein n=1 Tax=Roseococcus sp. SDR TaxID=2835532 RepID=UPI001BCEF208|nr:DUF2336 domain-containing protein [Roseococcus sp. SDR]MBS7790693.1 DUF2336 domain-containing protein [Roseococcus sp. SDR]MBV1846007.1 DUF2336 domain-containing protein [Roseococcus sp. SDR]
MTPRFPSAGALPERLALATRPDAPLLLLAADEAAPVRLAVAANPHAPALADALLARDPVAEIRARLARKLAWHAAELARMDWSRLRQLAGDGSPQVRHAVADTLADLHDAPHDLVLALARDAEPSVSEPLIRLSRVLTEDDLIALVQAPPGAEARQSVARRLNVPEAVAAAILRSGDPVAMAALRRNPTARLPDMRGHGPIAPKVGVIEASQI